MAKMVDVWVLWPQCFFFLLFLFGFSRLVIHILVMAAMQDPIHTHHPELKRSRRKTFGNANCECVPLQCGLSAIQIGLILFLQLFDRSIARAKNKVNETKTKTKKKTTTTIAISFDAMRLSDESVASKTYAKNKKLAQRKTIRSLCSFICGVRKAVPRSRVFHAADGWTAAPAIRSAIIYLMLDNRLA